jgi:beta-1,4-mannosyltransferase
VGKLGDFAAEMGSVCVVVLGDVGRSPRMQYHCMSLAADATTSVSLVGFPGETCVPEVEANPRIRKYLIASPFARAPRSLFLLWAPLKVALQVLQLLYTLLLVVPLPRAFLVQNPPSIPVLAVVWVAARLRGASFIIDWHNFGYTILGLGLGRSHPLVVLSRWYEHFFARRADGHLCVTNAMRKWLEKHWGVQAIVLYDRAPPFFRPTPADGAHELFARLAPKLPSELSKWAKARASEEGCEAVGVGATLMTHVPEGEGCPELRPDRPALLVSSTSWTADEDFSLLLRALVELDAAAVARPFDYSDFLVCVTGKGPLKAQFEAEIGGLGLRRVVIRTLWLEAADYPTLLGCADLGVCLHTSSSGLDLPMKVVDMYGAGTPVCAVDFACLSELVRHKVNGLVFATPAQLAEQLRGLFVGFPGEPSASALGALRRGVAAGQSVRWHDNWKRFAAPLFPPVSA